MLQAEQFTEKLRPFQEGIDRPVSEITNSLTESLRAGDTVGIAGAAMQLWGRRVPPSVISASLPVEA